MGDGEKEGGRKRQTSILSSFHCTQVVGYARKTGGVWSYSPDAVDILQEFKLKFPVMFDYLIKNPTDDPYYEQDLFPDPEG